MFFKLLLFSLVTFHSFQLIAQADPFLVELEPFSPGAEDMIRMMEGNPAEPFEAEDISGTIQRFSDYNGENLLLWFWATDDQLSTGLLEGLNLMHRIFQGKLVMLGFAYDNRTVVQKFYAKNQINFDIIPNSLRIGELLYGSELGLGRIVLVDRQGIVKKAIPRDFFIDNQNSFNQLRDLIQKFINEEN